MVLWYRSGVDVCVSCALWCGDARKVWCVMQCCCWVVLCFLWWWWWQVGLGACMVIATSTSTSTTKDPGDFPMQPQGPMHVT